MNSHHHHEILCEVTAESICRTIDIVLERIADRAPADLDRIRMRVRRFTSVMTSKDDPRDESTLGTFGGVEPYDFDGPGEVYIRIGGRSYVAIVAHELGHACTREEDFWDRDGYDSEWASEMTADFYAYSWGFGRNIGRHRSQPYLGHHGARPGQEFTEEHNGIVNRYRVTRSFKIRFIQSETPEGTVIETAAQVKARQMAEVRKILAQRSGCPTTRK